MPLKTRLTTNGFEAYLERIVQAGLDIDAAADAALSAGGEILQNGLRRRVPVKTGNLRDHIGVGAVVRDGNFHYIDVGILHGTDSDTARYGAVQEYGSANTAAQPYIRPTLDQDFKLARARMREIFKSWGLI